MLKYSLPNISFTHFVPSSDIFFLTYEYHKNVIHSSMSDKRVTYVLVNPHANTYDLNGINWEGKCMKINEDDKLSRHYHIGTIGIEKLMYIFT